MSKGPVFEAGPGWGARVGTWVKGNMLYLIPAVAVIVLIIIIASANKSDSQPESIEISASPSGSVTPGGKGLETIVTKDSYTLVARRVVNSRVTTSSMTISNGARLYAETKLAQDFKTQPLTVGSKISYDIATVDAYLRGFNDLYPTQKAKWDAMAKNVKF